MCSGRFISLAYVVFFFRRLYNSGVTQECDVDWMEVKSDFKRRVEFFIGLKSDHFYENVTKR